MTYQVFVYKLSFNFSLALIKLINGPANRRQKKRGREARMLSRLIYFFAPFPINYISHNYVIPQAMPHAIPQTHSPFYPHREFAQLWQNNRWLCCF